MNNKFKEPKERKITDALYIGAALMVMVIITLSIFAFINENAKEKAKIPKQTGSVSSSTTIVSESDKIVQTQPTTKAPTVTKPPVTTEENNPVIEPVIVDYASPVEAGSVSKRFDLDKLVYSLTMNDYRVHNGVDIEAQEGSAVCAIAEGEISRVYIDAFMGYCIEIDHGNGMLSQYKNLDGEYWATAYEGKRVVKGEKIAEIGNSSMLEKAESPHLHLEMICNGTSVDPSNYIVFKNSVDFED